MIADSLGNGVTEQFGYDAARMQLTSQKAGTAAPYTDRMNLTYTYNAATTGQFGVGSTTGNAGQLLSVSGTVNGSSESAAYTYDNYGRLVTSNQTSNGSTAQRRFAYDRWGNRAAVWNAVTGGSQIQSASLQLAFFPGTGNAPTNRLTSVTSGGGSLSYSYDANGNVTNDGLHSYAYDSENRCYQKAAGGTTTHYIWMKAFTQRRINRVLLLLVVAGCLCPALGCRSGQAKVNNSQETPDTSLSISSEQRDYITTQVPRLLVGESFWYGSFSMQAPSSKYGNYIENINREVPISILCFKGAVIVLIAPLNAAVVYVRMPDGHLDYPSFYQWGDILGIKEDEWSFDHIFAAVPGLSCFLRMIENDEITMPAEQKNVYLNLIGKEHRAIRRMPIVPESQAADQKSGTGDRNYLKVESMVTLLPLSPPAYDASDADKELLLNKIIAKAEEEAKSIFDAGDKVIITVPNFNVGDPSVIVLVEDKPRNGFIVTYMLNTRPKDEPICFAGGTWDIKKAWPHVAERVKKVQSHALKVLEHRVGMN